MVPRDAVEKVLKEYLSRMADMLRRWLNDTDLTADEIADAACWLLFKALPAFERFANGSVELVAVPLTGWRCHMDDMECLLLGEWELRSCDKICQLCKDAY